MGYELMQRSRAWLAANNISRAHDYVDRRSYIHLEAFSYAVAGKYHFITEVIPFVNVDFRRAFDKYGLRSIQRRRRGIERYSEYPLMFARGSEPAECPQSVITSVVWTQAFYKIAKPTIDPSTLPTDLPIEINAISAEGKMYARDGRCPKHQRSVTKGLVQHVSEIDNDGRGKKSNLAWNALTKSKLDDYFISLSIDCSDLGVAACFRESLTQHFKITKAFFSAFD